MHLATASIPQISHILPRSIDKIPPCQLTTITLTVLIGLCLACVWPTSLAPSSTLSTAISGAPTSSYHRYMFRTFFSGLRSSPGVNNMAPKKAPPPPTLPTAIQSKEEAKLGEGGEFSRRCEPSEVEYQKVEVSSETDTPEP